MGTVLQAFNDNDVMVRLSPFLDKNDKWTGELLVGIVSSDDSVLDDDDYFSIMQLATMLSAAVQLMEEDETFRDTLYNYMDTVVKGENEPEVQTISVVPEEDSNVVRLSFGQ